MLLVVSTRHSYEITPQPTAMNVVPESQRDIHSLLELSQIVHRQLEEKKKPLPAESRLDLCTEIIIWHDHSVLHQDFYKSTCATYV